MKTNLNNNYQPNFQAKISPTFENFLRNHFNNGSNRIQNNYRLTQKIAEYGTFGYRDYTLNLMKKNIGFGNEYAIVATKTEQTINEGIVITKKNSIKQIIEDFFSMTKNRLNRYMHKRRIYKM